MTEGTEFQKEIRVKFLDTRSKISPQFQFQEHLLSIYLDVSLNARWKQRKEHLFKIHLVPEVEI